MDSRISRRRAAARSDGSPAYVQRREEILQAAGRVFKSRGYGGANFADIAAELGADRASIYYYFASKEELFQHVVRDAVESNVQLVERLRQEQGSAAERLARVIRGLMMSYAEHYPYLHVYIQQDMSQVIDDGSAWARETHELNDRFTAAMVEIVQAGLDDGTLKPVASAQVITSGLLGMVNWTHRWFNPDGPLSAEEVGDAYVAMALDGLRA